jgi:phosphatidylinositol alpha-mannosyltransferase
VVDHADQQARTLRSLGVDARILVGNDPPGRLTRALHPRPGRHDEPPDYVIPLGRTVIVPANASLANLVLSPRALARMRSVLREEQFDVLHVHEPYAPVLSAFALAIADCPTVVTCHSSGGRWYPIGAALWGRLLRQSFDYRIAVSEQARRAAAPHVGGTFEIIPNGIVVGDEPDYGSRDHAVLFVGRHEPRKGLHVLLRAWPEIAKQTNARLRIVGADPLAVRFMMRRLNVPDEMVELHGIVPTEELTRQLRSAKVLVAPSLGAESFGLVLAEAFAAGTPAVASEIAGYVEVADDSTGVMVPPGDNDELVAATIGLLADEARRQSLGRTARQRVVERYDWQAIGRRLLGIYELLTGLRVAAPTKTT